MATTASLPRRNRVILNPAWNSLQYHMPASLNTPNHVDNPEYLDAVDSNAPVDVQDYFEIGEAFMESSTDSTTLDNISGYFYLKIYNELYIFSNFISRAYIDIILVGFLFYLLFFYLFIFFGFNFF